MGIADLLAWTIKAAVVISWVSGLFRLNRKRLYERLLLFILSVSVFNETTALLGLGWSRPLVVSVNLALHQLLWLALLWDVRKKRYRDPLLAIAGFCAVDIVFFRKRGAIACYGFVFTSLLYLAFFASYCLRWIRHEKTSVFRSSRFLLISAPLLFFLGLTAILGFRSQPLSKTEILGLPLYTIVNFLGNLFYYALVIRYLFRADRIHAV